MRVTVSPCPHCSWGSLAHGTHGNHTAISLIHGTYKKKDRQNVGSCWGPAIVRESSLYCPSLLLCMFENSHSEKKEKKAAMRSLVFAMRELIFFY